MFSKVPKWRPLETFLSLGKSHRGWGQVDKEAGEPQGCLMRLKILRRRGQCNMGRCHVGSSIWGIGKCDVWKLKTGLSGAFFIPNLSSLLEQIMFERQSVTDMLKTIPVEDFQRCYQKWEQCLHWCVAAQGNYFEGDNIDVWKKIKNQSLYFSATPRKFKVILTYISVICQSYCTEFDSNCSRNSTRKHSYSFTYMRIGLSIIYEGMVKSSRSSLQPTWNSRQAAVG